MQCGLLGEKLGHSYSPQIHRYLAGYSYDLFEKKQCELGDFLRSNDFSGLNVTIPYKKAVIPYCTELSERARQLGSVNTIVRRADGSLVGHNTDYFGFSYLVMRSGLQVAGKKALVLGSGGSSVTVTAVLRELGANVIVISRSGENNYTNLDRHFDAALIVNTTPVGMYPNTGISAIDLELFPALEGVLDLIYNPARTKLLLDAEKRGITAENGLWMLIAQAKESAEWFTGSAISDEIIPRIYAQLQRQMDNIILIGMPGSGKSTIGKLLAQRLGKNFVDADTGIETKAGMSIPEIFRMQGEAGFRTIETQVLGELGKKSGLVIATGGGCITRQENYDLLHQNGRIVWLQRRLEKLPTDGRPLSQVSSLSSLYQVRMPLYSAFADIIADNDCSIEDTVHHLTELLCEEE